MSYQYVVKKYKDREKEVHTILPCIDAYHDITLDYSSTECPCHPEVLEQKDHLLVIHKWAYNAE